MDQSPELRCATVIRRTGQRCKAIRVRGCNHCRMHGGGAVAVRRYREELAAICAHKRGGKPRAGRLEWLVQRLARADRNRPRAHSAKYERRHAEETERLLAEVSARRAGEVMRKAHLATLAVRPYRPVDCLMASARLAQAWAQTRQDVERVMLVQEMAGSASTWMSARLGEMLAPVLGWRAVRPGEA